MLKASRYFLFRAKFFISPVVQGSAVPDIISRGHHSPRIDSSGGLLGASGRERGGDTELKVLFAASVLPLELTSHPNTLPELFL